MSYGVGKVTGNWWF